MPPSLARGQLVAIVGLVGPADVPEDWQTDADHRQREVNGEMGQLLDWDELRDQWTVATFRACVVYVQEACLRPLAASDLQDFDIALGPASNLAAVGAELADALSRKGHALCRLFLAPEDLQDMVSTADRCVAAGAFARLPLELELGYLGRNGTGKTLAVDLDDGETAGFIRDSALRLAEDSISAVGAALRPFAQEVCGFDAFSRSTTMLVLPFRCDEEELAPPELEDGQAAAFLTMLWRAKLMVIINAGPEVATLTLLPKSARDQQRCILLQPGMLATFSIDWFKFGYQPEGKALSLLAFYLDRPQAYAINHIYGDLSYLVGDASGPPPPSKHQLPVVSVGTRYAFGADEPWKLFFGYAKANFDTQTRHPYARWEVDLYYAEDAHAFSGRSYTCHGGFSDGIELFDCRFFDISAAEARGMDPTQRQVLEVSYIALKGAGYTKQGLITRPANICTLVGLDKNEWRDIPKDVCGGFGASNSANAITANRFNYCLNLKGASMTIDTACSSSLVAQHTAKLYLLNNQYDPCEAAIVCGINLSLSPLSYIGCCAAGMHSHLGRCFTYNSSADGYARGESVGATGVKLKAWDAEAGDFALLAGSHVNQDGRSASLTAPNGPAQEKCSRAVMKEVGLKPADIDTTECHGTGTSLGDPIEIGAYRKVMGSIPREEPVVITTSKSNIGHCEGSAGIGGFLKTILMGMYAEGTPNCHLRCLNAHLDMEGFPGIITSEGVAFRGDASFNSVLSFGFGGTNACATVWGTNCITSRSLASKNMYAVVAHRLRDAPAQTVVRPSDDWEHWELDFPAKDVGPDDSWDVEIDDEGVVLYTKQDRGMEDLGKEYYLSGTFNDWGYDPLEPDGVVDGLYSGIVTIGSSGLEEFQMAADMDPRMTFCPAMAHCTRKSTKVVGPGEAQRDAAWCIRGVEGDRYRVEFHVSEARALSVSWTRDR